MSLESFKQFQKPKNKKVNVNKLIWGYTRVSSKLQSDNFSLKEQDIDIRKYANSKGFIIEKMIGGTYESASGDFDCFINKNNYYRHINHIIV